MQDERAAACIAAIDHGVLDDRMPSRRQRRKVLAVDVQGDTAAVLELTRGKRRGSTLAVHCFRREGLSWVPIGSGEACGDDPNVAERSALPTGSIHVEMAGSVGGRRRGARYAVVRVGPGIERVRWRRSSRVASPTGFALVVWRGRRPTVEFHDPAGHPVGQIHLDRPGGPRRRVPWRFRVRNIRGRHTKTGDWFNYAPLR